MIPSLGELRTIRRLIDNAISNLHNLPVGVRGRESGVLRALFGRVDKAVKEANAKAKRPPERDRKPGLLAGFSGPNVPVKAVAPEDLVDEFALECEELGGTVSAMHRELMVKFVLGRREFRRNARKALANATKGLEKIGPTLDRLIAETREEVGNGD
jgi:hypothetical protein